MWLLGLLGLLVPAWRLRYPPSPRPALQILIIITSTQETNQPAYVAVLAAQTTHRALLAGERDVGPVLCDRAAEFIDEAVR